MLGRLVQPLIAERGFDYPWGDLLPVLRSADLLLVNMEFTLTAHETRRHDGEYKAFYFRAEPESVAALQAAGVDFASIANNHVCDYRSEGLLETVQVLDDAGIALAGAGADLGAARRSVLLSAGGLRVAVLGWTDHPQSWFAGPRFPGTNYTPASIEPAAFRVIEDALRAARDEADLVIFSIHWGPNMRPRPTDEFKTFTRAVIDAGADVFWGHSAHLVQGIEIYRGKPILYDTGDLVDDYAVDEELRNNLSVLFILEASADGVLRLELIPVAIDDMQVNRARGANRDWLAGRIRLLSSEMGTSFTIADDRLTLQLTP